MGNLLSRVFSRHSPGNTASQSNPSISTIVQAHSPTGIGGSFSNVSYNPQIGYGRGMQYTQQTPTLSASQSNPSISTTVLAHSPTGITGSLSNVSYNPQVVAGRGNAYKLQTPTFSGGLPYKIDLSNTLRLNIVIGTIEEQNVDVIVCPTYAFPELKGVIAETMKNAGGQHFIQCCNQLPSLGFGEVKRRSGGGRLKCKHVYLTKIKTDWSKGSWQAMYDIVKECLEASSTYKQATIAFPVFGTGQSKYPVKEVAKAMLESVLQFSRCHTTSLTDVYIVVYIKDIETTRQIEKLVPKMFASATQKVPDSMVPADWHIATLNEAVEEVELDPTDRTFIEVKDKFKQGKVKYSKIEKIVRIENRSLWMQYQARKLRLETLNKGKVQNERELWHGTDIDTAKQIVTGGYNRGYAGKNAAFYGCGTYFAVESVYSGRDPYAKPDQNGVRRMILNKVLTGYYTKVDKNATVLPTRKTTPMGDIPFDSAVDDKSNPTMFIIFHDCQAYPQYLIEYRS